MLGNCTVEALCVTDGKKRLCHIRGRLRKKVWIYQGDVVLIGLREYQDAKADIIFKYNHDEARNLRSYGEIPEFGEFKKNSCGLYMWRMVNVLDYKLLSNDYGKLQSSFMATFSFFPTVKINEESTFVEDGMEDIAFDYISDDEEDDLHSVSSSIKE